MAGKGRRKTGKMLVEDKSARLVCFSKRRLGLFKKAEELAVLTGAQVGAIVFSPAGKPMAFNTASLEALINAHALQEESRSGDDWESRYHRYLKGEAASDWWKRSDVHSMGLEEARRFESAILTNRKKRPFDEMAGELTSLAVESSFNPQTVDDNMKKKKKKKKKMKLSVECPMNESLPSSYSVDATFMPGQDILDEIASYLQSSPVLLPFSDILPALSSDGSSFSGEATIDSIDFSCRSLTWDQFPEQQLLVQWNDECLVNASFPWDDFPEFQQQLSEAHFMEASLPQSFSDLEPMADNLNSLGASFSHSEQPAEDMDNSIISIPCIESLEQQLMADDWPMIDILSNDAFQENQSSLGQTVISLDQAPIADSSSSEDVIGTSFSPLPYFESFEQQLWYDDWHMNATFTYDEFQGHQTFIEQLELSQDLAPIEDFFPWYL